MPFPTIDPSVDEYYNPITEATYMRGPNNVWTQVDAFNKVDVDTLKDAFDAEYVNLAGDEMTGPLILNHAGDSTNLFELLGRRPGSADDVVNDRVFWMHHNAGTVGDAINYAGLIENDDNLVNKKYVDDSIAAVGAPSGFLPLDGGTMTGDITFNGDNNSISAGSVTNLTGRCTLLLTTAGTLPVGISSGSQTAKILSLYRYDNTKDDNRDEIATFQANGYTRLGGKLRIQPKLLAADETTFEINDGSQATLLAKTSGKLELKPTDDSGHVFAVYPAGLDANNGKVAFKVVSDGKVKAGHSAAEAFMASDDNDVVTKKFFDQQTSSLNYIPLSGSESITGQLTTNSLIKSTRGSYGAIEIKPNNSIVRGAWNTNGRIDITMSSNTVAAIRTVGAINVKKFDEGLDGDNNFTARGDYVRYYGQQSHDDDLATVKYVRDNAGGGPAVKQGTNTTPPSGEDRGTLLMTTDNKLYLYV